MYFDGSSSKEGAGAGIVLISPRGGNVCLMYKLEFHTTNNTTKYEALVMGLRIAKDLGIQQLAIFGDSELVVQRGKNVYQVKKQLLKVYRNEVWDLMDSLFSTFNISFIPRDQNQKPHSLSLAATFSKSRKILNSDTQLKLGIGLQFLDNIKHGRVFHDDIEINKF